VCPTGIHDQPDGRLQVELGEGVGLLNVVEVAGVQARHNLDDLAAVRARGAHRARDFWRMPSRVEGDEAGSVMAMTLLV
jgi:hypothetical protein